MPDTSKALVERLYTEHGSALISFLFRRTGSEVDAIDLAQETYMRMLQIADIEHIRDPRAYMFTIGANLAREFAISQSRARNNVDVNDPEVEPVVLDEVPIAEQVDQQAMLVKLREVFAELPVKCRAAWQLKHGHGLTYAEIAERLGVGKDMVKKYLSQALEHCQERMDPGAPGSTDTEEPE
jgi:RNA polymerase sigma factor (sigma-70 family)